jgi:hypothetical protein
VGVQNRRELRNPYYVADEAVALVQVGAAVLKFLVVRIQRRNGAVERAELALRLAAIGLMRKSTLATPGPLKAFRASPGTRLADCAVPELLTTAPVRPPAGLSPGRTHAALAVGRGLQSIQLHQLLYGEQHPVHRRRLRTVCGSHE